MEPEHQPLRVAIVDDHPLFLEATERYLRASEDVQVVGTAADGPAAIKLVDALRPDVLVLDLRLPGQSGLAVARWVRAHAPQTRIVVLTGDQDPAYQRVLRQLAVDGYLAKSATGLEVLEVVRRVARGEQALNLEPPACQCELTERELAVLERMAQGQRNAEIADELVLSVRTVEHRVEAICRKLGVRSRAAAVIRARELGLLRAE